MKKTILILVVSGVALVGWNQRFNGSFKPVGSQQAIVPVDYARLRMAPENRLPNCSGFTGNCDCRTGGITVQVSFKGFHWNKPNYHFLNMSGGSRGWRRDETYYGRRILQVRKAGQTLGIYAQWIWNSDAYGDLNRMFALNSERHRLFVAFMPFGFSADSDLGYEIVL